MNKEALILVDVQKDFWQKGAPLYVNDAESIIPVINQLMERVKSNAWLVIASKDWHSANHESFFIWPAHCVQNTRWAEYMDWLDVKNIDRLVLKWFNVEEDSYSAFGWYEFRDGRPLDDLNDILKDEQVNELTVVWLATDYCVKATVLDALQKFNYKIVRLVLAWARAVNINPEDEKNAIEEMRHAGAIIVE